MRAYQKPADETITRDAAIAMYDRLMKSRRAFGVVNRKKDGTTRVWNINPAKVVAEIPKLAGKGPSYNMGAYPTYRNAYDNMASGWRTLDLGTATRIHAGGRRYQIVD